MGQGLAALVIRRRHLHLPALAAEPGRHLFAIRDGNAGRGLPRPKRIRDKGKPPVQEHGNARVAGPQDGHTGFATHPAITPRGAGGAFPLCRWGEVVWNIVSHMYKESCSDIPRGRPLLGPLLLLLTALPHLAPESGDVLQEDLEEPVPKNPNDL